MEIIDNTLSDVDFNDLGISATFKYKEDYFLRIEGIKTQYDQAYNAVKLNSGTLYNFDASTKVIPFNCELIVL